MGKLIVDQIQKPGGSVFTLPSTASAGAVFSDSSGNLSISSVKISPVEGSVIGMVVTSSAQANTYGAISQWTSDGPGSQVYQARYVGNTSSDSYSTYSAWNMLMGDGTPTGTTERMFAYNRNGDILRKLYYANNKRLGHMRDVNYYDQNTTDNYTGITISVLPVRNTTSSSITRTFSFYHSSDYSSYGGGALAVYTPTNNVAYSEVIGGTWSQSYTYTSSSNQAGGSASVAIPANTTVLLVLASSHNYSTTHKFVDVHYYYNLDTPIDGTSIICDLRMLNTLATNRNSGNTGPFSLAMPNYYTQCAQQFGDR
jgi:hypothetical protein